MSLSAHTFTDITRLNNPSEVAYYMAHAYATRAETLAYPSRTDSRKRLYRRAFLTEIAKKYLKLSDELVKLENEFMRRP